MLHTYRSMYNKGNLYWGKMIEENDIWRITFFGGLIWVIALVIVAVFNSWDYNGITGLMGSLLGTGTMSKFILFCVMGLISVAICAYEAYIQK